MDFSLLAKSVLIYSAPLVRVYKGTYESSPVVIKELFLPSQQAIEAAAEEFRIQQGLSHPNICKAYGCYAGTDGHSLTFVLEALEIDLAREIANRRNNAYPWQEAELWTYFVQLVTVFAYAQEAGVCHRDIKPQNIFVTSDKQLKVGDFGAAKVLEAAMTTTVVGTPVYASPELQFSFKSGQKVCYDPYRSDVYSLGLTFLCMVQLTERPLGKSGERVEGVVAGLAVSEGMKGLLGYMLQGEMRPDFLELRQYLYSLYNYSADAQLTPQLSPDAIQALEHRLNSDQHWENALIELLSLPVLTTWSGECLFPCFGCSQMYSLRWLEVTSESQVCFCSSVCYENYYQRLAEENAPRTVDNVPLEEIGSETEDPKLLLPTEEVKESGINPLPNPVSALSNPLPAEQPKSVKKTNRPPISIRDKPPPKSQLPQKSLPSSTPAQKPISNPPVKPQSRKPPPKSTPSPTAAPGPVFQVTGKSCAHPLKSPF